MRLSYWIEVGRCPEIADKHPEWMASVQGHPEWRLLFPGFRAAKDGEVVKAYPWVPIAYKEAFAAHLDRIRILLRRLPQPDGIFLNDLQAGPSACGCGNPLCRWTTDYGPLRTATQMGPDSAARFVESVRKLSPRAEVIPVWLTECQEHEKRTACAGVSCFTGACWRDYTQQLMPLAATLSLWSRSPHRLGVLLTHTVFRQPESWIASALKSFQEMPPKRDGIGINANRLIPVLQGGDSSLKDRAKALKLAGDADTHEYVIALTPFDQSWEPRLFQTKTFKSTIDSRHSFRYNTE